MRQKKRLLALFAVFALVLMAIPAIRVKAAFSEETKKSVAVLACYEEYADARTGEVVLTQYGWGSCFFIGEEGKDPQYLISNYHVVDEYVENGKGDWTDPFMADIGAGRQSLVERVTLRVYYDGSSYDEAYLLPNSYDDVQDVAVLRLDKPTSRRNPIKLQIPANEMQGKPVYVIGFPGMADNTIANPISTWSLEDATVNSGVLSRLVTSSSTGTRLIQTDAVIQMGHSGSPLVNDDGAAIGINTKTVQNWMDGEEANYAVNIEEVITYLNMNNVKYDLFDPSEAAATEEEEKTETVEEEPQETEPAPAQQPAEPAPKPEPEKGGFPIWVIGVIAVIVIVIIGLVLALTLGKKNQQPNVMQQPQGMPGQSGGMPGMQQGAAMAGAPKTVAPSSPIKKTEAVHTPSVRSLAVQHHGKTVTVTEKPLLIGRDPSACQIVFDEATPGVSGRHCQLTYDKATNEFLLTDLRSSYGTFLANGQKLDAGVAYHMKAGDSFYLGEQANSMRVEIK